MSNIAKVIKAEITRLARKETKAAQETVRAVTAQHRREIANLKGQLAALKRQVTALEKQAHGDGHAPQATAPLLQTRFVPKGLISTRKRLGLSAADLAKMLGVSAQTIYNWERRATKPRADQQAKLASLRHVGKRQVRAYLTAG